MTPALRRGLASAALIGATGLTMPVVGSAAPSASRADLVASAHASEGLTSPRDERASVVRLRSDGRGRATATSSATCDGCASIASTVQVLYGRQRASVDNVAVAWATSCSGCEARSVAVQVAVLSGRGRTDVAATNQALAVNAACDTCSTDAVAVQYVVVGTNGRQLSRHVRAELEALAAQLAANAVAPQDSARRSTGPEARSGPDRDALDAVGDSIEADLGGSVTLHLDQRRG